MFYRKQPTLCGNQSGFKSDGSCVNQLLAINYEILSSFDGTYEVRGVFLDIAKTFNKVWHEGTIHLNVTGSQEIY